jgi:hypothetical protein
MCHRNSKAHNARHRRASPCKVHAATGTYTNIFSFNLDEKPYSSAADANGAGSRTTGLMPIPQTPTPQAALLLADDLN